MSYYQAVYTRLCSNCGKKLYGQMSNNGSIKFSCSICGYAAVSKRKGRARFATEEFFDRPGVVLAEEKDFIPDEDDSDDEIII